MSRSSITICAAGLVFIASIIASFTLGVSQNTAQSGFVIINSSLKYETPDQDDRIESMLDQTGLAAEAYFTYQGVLNDLNDDPVVGPVSLDFRLILDSPGGFEVLTTSRPGIMPDEQGRFQTIINLPSPQIMSGYTSFRIEVIDVLNAEQIGTDIEITPTPFAWLSDHARTAEYADIADFAESAEEANYADFAGAAGSADSATHAASADVADALTNDTNAFITPIAPFENYIPDVATYGALRADRSGKMIHLSGLIRPIAETPDTGLIGTLPSGMRPAENHMFAVVSLQHLFFDDPMIRIEISPNGDIRQISGIVHHNWISLSGISFPVAD